MTQAFKIITSDPQVQVILVNIFGGIVDCTIIANGIIAACRETKLKLPLVVRLEGELHSHTTYVSSIRICMQAPTLTKPARSSRRVASQSSRQATSQTQPTRQWRRSRSDRCFAVQFNWCISNKTQKRIQATDSLSLTETVSAGISWLCRNELSVDWLRVRSEVVPDNVVEELSVRDVMVAACLKKRSQNKMLP